ncbi:RsmE family RNA methyltransferase [Nitriliruptor alkaliphilus]|uniref:RsmE family RNA methyltransferase n=1 Tax=Nitriliruptor alkaliphilus TaxID=427918 RepID=UPI000696ECFD|nr:16S rRNA (uracil(1498)-N(3))-methyltransferase [Nitriliruptor alkaliphilus]
MSLVPYLHLDAPLAGAQVGSTVAIDPAARHHLARVLRLRDGAALEVSDGRGHAAAARLAGDHVEVTATVTAVAAPQPTLSVAQGLPRGRKLDEVVRQVTELGADRIVPVAASRSVTRLDGARADKAVERWQAVARAAAEQSRSPWRPEVLPIVTPAQLPGALPAGTRLLIAHPDAPRSLPEAAADLGGRHVSIAVGPEGGWDDDEVAGLLEAGATLVGLGPTVLRTEHAAAAAVAVLAAVTGRWA